MDGTGENKSFQKKAVEDEYNIDFQMTPRRTPQFNGVVERAFAYVLARLRAMNYTAKFDEKMKGLTWAEGVVTATKLDNILARSIIDESKVKKSSYYMFHGKDPVFVAHARTYGEAGVVALRNDMQSSLANRGIKCMFVGYGNNSTSDAYRMLNLETGKVWIT